LTITVGVGSEQKWGALPLTLGRERTGKVRPDGQLKISNTKKV